MTTQRTLLALALLAAGIQAQTAPCLSVNDANTNVSTAITAMTSSPNVWAWQYTPPQSVIVQSGQIYTNNNYFPQSMGLEIWSDDPATSLPNARIAGGYWKISQSAGNAWQGTNFNAPVLLIQATKYWLVWVDPAWSTVPIEPGGTTLPWVRLSGTTWISGAASAFKVRLFCNLLDQQNVTTKGGACSSAAGFGTAFVNQAPTIGNTRFMLEGSGFPSGVTAFLILGVNPNWPSIPVPGAAPTCFIHTDPFLLFAGTTGSGNVRNPAGADGQFVFPLPIPADASLIGAILSAQLAALDLTSTFPTQVVTSNGLRLTFY